MRYSVALTEDAYQDLLEIGTYIAEHDGPAKAEAVLRRIEQVWSNLESSPQRGAHPPELLALGIHDYRQAFFKPYRVIYQVTGERVIVVLIADGRRDMRTLLQRRLLGP